MRPHGVPSIATSDGGGIVPNTDGAVGRGDDAAGHDGGRTTVKANEDVSGFSVVRELEARPTTIWCLAR